MKKSILMAIALFSLILGVVLGSIRFVSLFADDDGIIEWNSIGVEELV